MTNVNQSFDFGGVSDSNTPLAARLRPNTIDEYIGQQQVLSPKSPLYKAIKSGQCHSLILWGPPGTGKTTLAEIIARHANACIERLSAVTSGIKEIRQAIDSAKMNAQQQKQTILFVDEVHRFNKSQQDAFLPYIEDGTIVFIGATTENPAFELNRAILSRAQVYTLNKLTRDDLSAVFDRAQHYYSEQQGLVIVIDDKAKQQLFALSSGDARRLLNLIETSITLAGTKDNACTLSLETIKQVAGNKVALYDKSGDAFYDLISAFHKSVRGSDPDAALYWYARILEGGGDALYVARRLLAIASEDVGNADPRALPLAIAAWDTYHRVGPAEGERAIAQAAVYMSLAAKSNAVYSAFNKARALAKETSDLEVPFHLRNSTSEITKDLGHGLGYRYAHDEIGAYAAGENYFPEEIAKTELYHPVERGLETKLKQKKEYLKDLDSKSDEQRYK